MGLDISVYNKLKEVKNAEMDEDGNVINDELLNIKQKVLDYTEKHFEGRTQGIHSGAYKANRAFGFCAGGYIGYGLFRDKLSDLSQDNQFYELINFSDCEGYIGSVISKKLAKDFGELEKEAESVLYSHEFETYLNFKKAFEEASKDGIVCFC